MTPPCRLVLLGPPGAGCESVGQAVSQAVGVPFDALAAAVAEELGVSPHTALVEVSEPRYRQVEADCAPRLLGGVANRAGGGVLALGSGCLDRPPVLDALTQVRQVGGHVVTLVASARCLATRNGLDAPRSVGMGAVYHQFTQLLRVREATCRRLADVVVDTTRTSVQEAADQVLGALTS